MAKGSDRIKLTVKNDEGDSVDLLVDFNWWRDPGRMYYPDGSGDPPDCGAELTGYCTVDHSDVPDWVTDELVQEALDEADF